MHDVRKVVYVVTCVLFAGQTFADDATNLLKSMLKNHKASCTGLSAWKEMKPSSGEAFRVNDAVYMLRNTGPADRIPRLNTRIKKSRPAGPNKGAIKVSS